MKDPLFWQDGKLHILDQTRLPLQEEYIVTDDLEDVAQAIERLSVRGAPNIGLTALFGAYIGIAASDEIEADFERAFKRLARTRPTAYDLFAALKRAQKVFDSGMTPDEKRANVLKEAHSLKEELIDRSRLIGKYGADLVPRDAIILTHCNTGALAAPGDGTAFSVIAEAHRQGKVKIVYADETRPLLQGARLTMWELMQRDIPCRVNVDSAAGILMSLGKIDFIVTGADRIAANGDSANKIGTYTLAVLAKRHDLPFYIAAPTNTVDMETRTGSEIEIENRESSEVTSFWQQRTTPSNAVAENYAFDVTPAELITGIITEKGVISPEAIGDQIK